MVVVKAEVILFVAAVHPVASPLWMLLVLLLPASAGAAGAACWVLILILRLRLWHVLMLLFG